MAARRGKSQARRNNGPARGGMPGWAWLVIGLALGVALIVFGPRLLDSGKGDFFRPKPNPDARPAAASDEEPLAGEEPVLPRRRSAADEPDEANAPAEREYDFYTVLSGKEVPMSDAELAASARAEAQGEDDAAADLAEPVDEAPDLPRPVEDAPVPRTDAKPPARSTANATRPAATPADTRARYLLQAGAFEASGQAEELKAKIALLGLGARVESAQIRGTTVFRVRLGPYGSAAELAEAKQKLESGGLQAMPIRLQ